jgi:hypothetical protein
MWLSSSLIYSVRRTFSTPIFDLHAASLTIPTAQTRFEHSLAQTIRTYPHRSAVYRCEALLLRVENVVSFQRYRLGCQNSSILLILFHADMRKHGLSCANCGRVRVVIQRTPIVRRVDCVVTTKNGLPCFKVSPLGFCESILAIRNAQRIGRLILLVTFLWQVVCPQEWLCIISGFIHHPGVQFDARLASEG